MTVHFIGAGPGAADLITVRGRASIDAARLPLCRLASCRRRCCRWCPPGRAHRRHRAVSISTRSWRSSCGAHERGEDVARLHSGDLSIWSAMGEQLRRLDALGIPYTITPGVPAFAAAAAALGRELTLPEVGAIAWC